MVKPPVFWENTGRSNLEPHQALERLRAGNQRHAQGSYRHPHRDLAWRRHLVAGQRPWAAILGCSDSRVPPEVVFDQGLGDLFVVRTAGHVCDAVVLASLRYAVEHLGVSLVVVLGHSGCGAVQAALAQGESTDPLCVALRPTVERARLLPGDPEGAAVRLHVQTVTDTVRRVLSGPTVVGALYDLTSGRVEFLEETGAV